MGYFEGDEEKKYRNFFIPAAAGAVIFLFGLFLLIFGRGYGSDGTNYDLYVVFGSFFLLIGFLVGTIPLFLQLKILFKGIKRDDQVMPPGYIPAQSAAEQMMRATQIFSSAPPSTYEGQHGAGMQPQQPRYNQPHQFSSAAGPYATASMERFIETEGSLKQPGNFPSYGPTGVGSGQNFRPQQQYGGHSSEI